MTDEINYTPVIPTQRREDYAVIRPGGPLSENSALCRCDHEGDARRIAMLWARHYKTALMIEAPDGTTIRVDTDGNQNR